MKSSLHALLLVVFSFQILFTFPVSVDAATNRVPTATAQSVTTNEDTSVAITLSGADYEGAPLTFSISSQPNKGSLSCVGASCLYTPTANYNGTDFFNFKTNDGSLTSRAARVSLTINAVNDAPTATSNSLSVTEDVSATFVLQASDTDKDSLSYQIATQPTRGTISLSGNSVTFKSLSNVNGNDSFTFTVSDGKSTSAPATISISINPVNDAPTAVNQTVSTNEATSVMIALSASDVDGDALTATIGHAAVYGTVTVSGLNVTYTPDSSFSGADSFTYRVSDGAASSAVATVSITVNPVNDIPVVEDLSFEVGVGGSTIVNLIGSDPEGSALTFSILNAPNHGTAVMTAPATFAYKPSNGYTGTDSLSFVASDGSAVSLPGDAQITVLEEGFFVPVSESTLTPLDNTVDSSSDKIVVTLAQNDCYQFQASPLVLSGTESEYIVGTLNSNCLNYVATEHYQFFVDSSTGESFSPSSALASGVYPNASASSVFDGNTLVTPLISTAVDSDDVDEPTGGLFIQQFNADGTIESSYVDAFEGRAVHGSLVVIDDLIPTSTVNNNKPTCQRLAKLHAEFCGIFGFIHAQTKALMAIAFTSDNDYEADFNGESRAIVKNAVGNVSYDRIVWGTGTGGNNADGLANGGGCTVRMVNKALWWETIATGTFTDFNFFANNLDIGGKSYDPGDFGCTDGSTVTNNNDSIKSAMYTPVVGINPSTKRPVYWVKGYQSDVFDGEGTRISQLDENLNLVCDLTVNSGKGKNPFNGGNTSIVVDSEGTAYTNANFYDDQGHLRTGVLAIDPSDCSKTSLLEFNSAVVGGYFSGVTLAEDSDSTTRVLTSMGGALYVYDLASASYTTFELGSASDDNVSAAAVLDALGQVITVSESNVLTILKDPSLMAMGLTYGEHIWPRPGKDNWGTSTAVLVLP